MYVNTWSTVGGMFGEAMGPFKGGTLLEEACHLDFEGL